MTDNVLRLIMPMLKTDNGGGDVGLILPLVLLIAVDSGDMPLMLCLLYIIMQ
ncbi:MAG: hypothetical protein IKB88_08330 [Clostridia bacterium]|nr:hypothetical protein [Clostridia bacterium]